MTNVACAQYPGDSSKPPDKDWFGNPLPTADPKCNVKDGVADPVNTPHVPAAPPGWKTASFELQVKIKGNNAHKHGGVGDLCLPVGLHVYGSIAGMPGVKLDVGGPKPVPLPWDGIRTTPWSAFLVAQYDATKTGSPVVHIDLIATWVPEPGWLNPNLPDVGEIQLTCDIVVNGQSVRVLKGWGKGRPDLAILNNKPGNKTAHCDLTMTV